MHTRTCTVAHSLFQPIGLQKKLSSYYFLTKPNITKKLRVTSEVPGGRIDPLYNILASHTTHVVCVNCIREWRNRHLHTIDNVRKNWTNRIGYCMTSRGSHLNEIIFHY